MRFNKAAIVLVVTANASCVCLKQILSRHISATRDTHPKGKPQVIGMVIIVWISRSNNNGDYFYKNQQQNTMVHDYRD